MTNEEPCVHRDVAFKATEILGEGFPAPVGAVFERCERHALDLGHHLAQIVGITWKQGRQRETTVATDDCGDAVVARWACRGIPQQLSVVVRVRIDDARGHNESRGIEHFGGRVGDVSDRNDATIADADVGNHCCGTGAIDHRAT